MKESVKAAKGILDIFSTVNTVSNIIVWYTNGTDYHYSQSGFLKSLFIIWILIIFWDPNGPKSTITQSGVAFVRLIS